MVYFDHDNIYTARGFFVCFFLLFTHPDVTVHIIPLIATHIRYVTRQLFGQFRADQFISKLSITVTVYQQI